MAEARSGADRPVPSPLYDLGAVVQREPELA